MIITTTMRPLVRIFNSSAIHYTIFLERRNEVKSWPPASASSSSPPHNFEKKSDSRSFLQKLSSSLADFMRRREPADAEYEGIQSLPSAEDQRRRCCDCSLEEDDTPGRKPSFPPIYRGINISSSSICSIEPQIHCQEQTSKLSHLKKIFSPTNSPRKIYKKITKS